jgi:hypothetical protein
MKMGLLKSVNNVPGIDFYDYRDDDYYNKYVYRVRFSLPGIRYTWYSSSVEEFMDRYNATTGWKVINKKDKPDVTKNIEAIKAYIEWRNLRRTDKSATSRIERDTVSIFSNDLSLLKTIETIDPKLSYDYTEVQKSQFTGVKSFVNKPNHSYRIYLKSKLIPQNFCQELSDLLSRSKNLHPSNALKLWLKGYSLGSSGWRYRYTNPSHFIDYDDESTLSYLTLMHGEIFGKRYKLEKRPEPV